MSLRSYVKQYFLFLVCVVKISMAMTTMSFGGKLPLVTHPIHGGNHHPSESTTSLSLDGKYQTIGDVPNNLLANGKEYAMIIPIDITQQKVLLKIPNKLGWRYHFGCYADENPHEQFVHALLGDDCSSDDNDEEEIILNKAGLMFFTFQDHESSPMRVKVFTCNIPTTIIKTSVGVYFDFDKVPYSEMWADDCIWMPNLLLKQQSSNYFEAHFVFDGPPGPKSSLVTHSYKLYNDQAQ